MDGLTKKIRKSVGALIYSGAHLNAAEATQYIAKKLGLSERMINYTHIELRGKLNEDAFKEVPFNERIMFLSHCLRNTKECKAEYGEEGLDCLYCNSCQIGPLKKMAEEKGYKKVFIAPGGSMVYKLMQKYRPKAVLGIACHHELTMGMDKAHEFRIPSQGVMLLREGCKDTEVNMEEAKEKIALIELNGKRLNGSGKH